MYTFLTKECYWEIKEGWDVAKNFEFVTWTFCLHLDFFLYRYCRWNIIFRYCGIHYWYSEFAAYPTTFGCGRPIFLLLAYLSESSRAAVIWEMYYI